MVERRPRLVRELLPHVRVVVADEVERLRDNIIKVLADELGVSRADEVEWRINQHVGFYSCGARCLGREHQGSACSKESKSSYLSHRCLRFV